MKNVDIMAYKDEIAKFEKLKKFEELLLFYNAKFNLTSITEEDEIFYKHFYDSLEALCFLTENASVVEIGSGGGFPSVPLKIFRNDLKFTLIEATGKKCDYLKIIKREFGFENFEVNQARCEEIIAKNGYREAFDFAVARAVARLNTLLEYALPFVKVGGIFIAYKGSSEQTAEEIKEAANALKVLGGKVEMVHNYSLGEFGERNLVIIRKTASTPAIYPRGNGRERSKPL